MRILSFIVLIFFTQNIYAMNVDFNQHLKELEEKAVTVIPQVLSHDDMIKYKAALMPIEKKWMKHKKNLASLRSFRMMVT